MAEQRQPFRFRLPWLPAPAAPRPTPTPTPTPAQPAPTQSATAIPFQRPPIRPPGIGQVQPPPPPQEQVQASPTTESQVQSPSLAAARSPVTSPPTSPVRYPFRVGSVPSSPQPTSPTPTPTPTPAQPAPTQSATAIPFQRPPFRPPGIGQVQPPPPPQEQVQASPTTESQVQSPSLAAARSPVTSPPTSPVRYPFRVGSVPSSPQPTSPPWTATRVLPRSQAVSQPASPSKKSQSSIQESSPAPPTYTWPQTLVSRPEEIKPAVSQMQPQEPQTKAQITTETPKAQDQNILGTTVKVAAPKALAPPQKSVSSTFIEDDKPTRESDQRSEKTGQGKDDSPPQSKTGIPSWTLPTSMVAAQPSQAPGSVAAALPTSVAAAMGMPSRSQKPDSYAITSVWKPFPSEPKSEETEERKKVEQELKREEKTEDDGPTDEAPKQRTEAEIPTISSPSKIQIKEQQTVTFPGVQKQPGKQEFLDRKGILSTSGPSGRQHKMAISHPKDRSPVSEPRPKPATFNGERAPLHKEIREDISKFVHKLTTGHPKQPMDEKPVSITNLVGQNRGASMHFGPESAKKDASLHIHRGYKANTDEGGVETTTEGEGSSREDSMIKEVQATKAYINSNVQSINNSISFDVSVTERNPGVQLGLSCTPTALAKFGCKEETLEAHKAECSVTPSQKLTYEPVIKRRCLRGLFLESSDSDPDNPEKPKRHGCRYGCGEKSKGNNTDVL